MAAARHAVRTNFRQRARARLRKALLCATVIVAAFVVPAAEAPAHGAVLLLPGSTTSLSAAFNGSAPTLAKALLCPLANGVQAVTSTVPGVSTLTNEMANLLCALSVVGYAYRTTYYPPTGPPQVRYYRALAGVPAVLDVDGNGVGDFIGTVRPTLAIPGIQLDLTRVGLPKSTRVKIEAVFLDPVDNGTWVGIGEDGSAAGTAPYWSASIGAFLDSGSSIDLQLNLHANDAPPTLAALGEAFFGTNPDAPTSIDGGTMSMTPVPVDFTTRLRVGPSSQIANITTTVPTVLGAHVQVISPGDEKDIDATVDQLPDTIQISHSTDNGHELVTYAANAAINKVTGQYHDRAGNSILTAAQVDITGLPSQFSLDQFDGKTVFNVPNGSIGNVEVRYATGQDVPASPAGTGPYVAFHRYSSSHLTAGLRLGQIQSVSFDSTGPYVGDVVFASAPTSIPLSFQDDVSGITATGSLSNLPAHLTVTIDLAGGQVVFDGHGTGIHEIQVSATKTGGTFFTRASRIALDVIDLPALDTISFTPSGTAANFTPSAPIGSVSLLASDGTGAPSVTGDYVSYEDTPSRYRIYLQMNSIAGVSFSTSPAMTATLQTGVSQPLVLFAHIADQAATKDITFNGLIKNLPTSLTVTADLDHGQVTYNANDTIDEIDVSARDSIGAFFGRASRLDLSLLGLPKTNTINFEPSGKQVTFTPSSPIQSVSLLASDGTGAPNVSGDYASYEDTPLLYRIYLQMLGISGASFTVSPMSGSLRTSSPQTMVLHGRLVSGTTNITLDGTIDKLPDAIDFSLAKNGDGSSTVDYNAHGEAINQITLDGSGLPLPLGADSLHAEIDGLPSHITAVIPAAGGTASFDPHGGHIGRLLVQAYPHGTGAYGTTANEQTAYVNLQTGQLTADIRNIGYTSINTGSPLSIKYDISSAPLNYNVTMDDGTYFKGQVHTVEPATITVNTANGIDLNYLVDKNSSNFTGNGEIDKITVQSNLGGGSLDATLQHIAPKLEVCFNGAQTLSPDDPSTPFPARPTCKPNFVPNGSFGTVNDDGSAGPTYTTPPSLFDFEIKPQGFDGSDWPTRFRLDGTWCFSQTDQANCENSDNKNQRLEISDLEFGTIEVGAGFHNDNPDNWSDCEISCGRAYVYFNTDNTSIGGDVKYFPGGNSADDPLLEYIAPNPDNGIEASNEFQFLQWDVGGLSLDHVHGGSFSCPGTPHLNINDVPVLGTVDLLNGSIVGIDYGIC